MIKAGSRITYTGPRTGLVGRTGRAVWVDDLGAVTVRWDLGNGKTLVPARHLTVIDDPA